MPKISSIIFMFIIFLATSCTQRPDTFAETVIPKPVTIIPENGKFRLSTNSVISADPELLEAADYLSSLLSPLKNPGITVSKYDTNNLADIILRVGKITNTRNPEGYRLIITVSNILLTGNTPEGVFRGVQTLLQLFPPEIELASKKSRDWLLPCGVIIDYPRYEWRGVMLDVARHFFSVEDVKRYIEQISRYKINRFHIHLTDDQGWRIMIKSRPRLAEYGGSTEVGGGPGGYYTQEQYSEITAFAAKRYILVIPEIDMPSHVNAAQASCEDLNSGYLPPPLYTGVNVGFNHLDATNQATYRFVDDVIRELASITPGPYIHIGGDEAIPMSTADYDRFMKKTVAIVTKYGKTAIGWEEIISSKPSKSTIVQLWRTGGLTPGNKIIVSPANRTFLAMKYNFFSPIGYSWAGYIDTKKAYDWDPSDYKGWLTVENIIGIESSLWTETVKTMKDIEYMTFPRLPGLAELAWSPKGGKNWDEYKIRLGSHGRRLKTRKINFYKDRGVPWK